jgi:hypothetical protein
VRRRLLKLLTALSLLLFVAVAVMWVRSHFVSDRFLYTPITVRPGGFRAEEYVVDTHRGVVSVCAIRHDYQKASMPAGLYDATLHQHFTTAFAAESKDGWRRRPGLAMDLPPDDGFDFRKRNEGGPGHRGVIVEWDAPYWFLLLLCSLPAALLLIAASRRRRRSGLCPTCGYDLRATPGRCPECGTTPEAEATRQSPGETGGHQAKILP